MEIRVNSCRFVILFSCLQRINPILRVQQERACGHDVVVEIRHRRGRSEEGLVDRRRARILAERAKVQRGEKGFFAVCEGKMAGSIWATVNESAVPTVVRGFMRLMPREALVHDIVTGTKFRGLGIGPFMVTQICPILLQQWGVSRIIIDVNVRNSRSLKMMNKAGLRAQQKALAISAFQTLVFHKTIRRYA